MSLPPKAVILPVNCGMILIDRPNDVAEKTSLILAIAAFPDNTPTHFLTQEGWRTADRATKLRVL